MVHSSRNLFVRDIIVATAAIVALYGLGQGVQFQPVQIPGYLLIVAFDLLEVTFGSAGSNYDALFATYILALGVAAGGVGYALRRRAGSTDLPNWRFGASGALALVGVLSLLFALNVFLGAGFVTPVLVTGATGVVLLALAAWTVGVGGGVTETTGRGGEQR